MNTIVTGAAGFIGSHLVKRLLTDGHRVVAVDNFSRGITEYTGVMGFPERLTTIKCDIRNCGRLGKKVFNHADWVFHLAGRSGSAASINDPQLFHDVNVNGTVQLLNTIRNFRIRKFIYPASASCYGNPEKIPTPESQPVAITDPYSLTKYTAEQYIKTWGDLYRVPWISLRLFNVYGDRILKSGNYGPVLSLFLTQKRQNLPFTVSGDGSQSRDFIYISDVSDAMIMAAKSDVTGGIFNVGSGTSNSIKTLAELLEGPVKYIPLRPGEPDVTRADISKIKKLIGWKPKVNFIDGISMVLQSYRYWQDSQ
jgi:UDP-glucose 4-epimerase